MNSASKHAVIALLVLFIAGCAPKNAKTAPPAQAQAPPITAGKAGAMYPPPLTESQTQTEPAPAPAPVVAKAEPEPAPPPPPPETTKKTTHKPKPSAAKPAGTESGTTQTAGSEATAAGTAAPPTETADVAANSEPAAASPIGQLTPVDTPEQAQKGKDTGDLINKTEDGLNSIKRQLSTQEQETVSQIRAFLSKARTALTNQDYDGAYILATKAKVLLDELNKT